MPKWKVGPTPPQSRTGPRTKHPLLTANLKVTITKAITSVRKATLLLERTVPEDITLYPCLMIPVLSVTEICVTDLTLKADLSKMTSSLSLASTVSNSKIKCYLKAKTRDKYKRIKLIRQELKVGTARTLT
jgi:hypothetical protein